MLHGGAVFWAAKRMGADYRDIVDFSANMNPFGCPDSVKRAVRESLERMEYYPDAGQGALREAIAGKEQLPADWVYAGNGAADLIFRLCYALRPARALVCAPTFLEYEKALKAAGAQTLAYPLAAPGFFLQPDYRNWLDALEAGDMAFLCNPNNPTGLETDRKLLEQVVVQAQERGVYLVVDECFLDFTAGYPENSVKRLLEGCGHLVILKSFTKMYALPGIRLGYLLTSGKEILDRVRMAGQDWSISCAAEAAGIAACREAGYARESSKQVRLLREPLKKGLEECGFETADSQANYLFFRAPGIRDLQETLMQRKLLIRSCQNYPGLGREYYRIAVRTGEENQRLLLALGEITGKRKTGGMI